MSIGVDYFTSTEADAAAFEQAHYGEPYDPTDDGFDPTDYPIKRGRR